MSLQGWISRSSVDKDPTPPPWWRDWNLINAGAQKFALESKEIQKRYGGDPVPYMPPGSTVNVQSGTTAGKLGTALLAGALGVAGTAAGMSYFGGKDDAHSAPKDPPAVTRRAKLIDNATGNVVWSGELPNNGQVEIPVDNGTTKPDQ